MLIVLAWFITERTGVRVARIVAVCDFPRGEISVAQFHEMGDLERMRAIHGETVSLPVN